jgi:electron transport complex protein RnfE
MGLGFTIVLIIVGTVREILGSGTWAGLPVLPENYIPVLIFILPPGGFITLALLLGGFNYLDTRKARK